MVKGGKKTRLIMVFILHLHIQQLSIFNFLFVLIGYANTAAASERKSEAILPSPV